MRFVRIKKDQDKYLKFRKFVILRKNQLKGSNRDKKKHVIE